MYIHKRVVLVRAPGSGVTEMQELRQALKQLAILDSAVRVFEQEDGDLALVTSGEVHLQKCIFVRSFDFFPEINHLIFRTYHTWGNKNWRSLSRSCLCWRLLYRTPKVLMPRFSLIISR